MTVSGVFACFLCWLSLGACAESVLTLDPDNLVLNPDNYAQGGTVTATCGVTSLGQDETLILLYLTRTVTGSAEEQILVSAVNPGGEYIATDIPGGTGTTNITGGDVKFVMTQAKCPDGGSYTCEATIFSDDTKTSRSVKDLTVEVSPWNITLQPTPSGKTSWRVHEVVHLLCIAPVGTVVEGVTEVEWVWQFKSGRSSATRWEDYSGDSSDIEDVGNPITANCLQLWKSRLTRNLTLDDSNGMYRCFIRKDGRSYTEYAAEVFVGTVTGELAPSTSEPSAPSTSGSPAPSTSEVLGPQSDDSYIGLAIGAWVTLSVVLIVNLIVIVWLWRRQWKLPCVESGAPTGLNEQATDQSSDYLEPIPGPVNYSGPYDSLRMADVGQRSVYSEITYGDNPSLA